MGLAHEIDKLINKQYYTMTSKSGKGELAQLTRLFSKNFTDGLAKIVYQYDSIATNQPKSVSVELGYIDKQPYAKYNKNGKNICGELADVLFVYREEWNISNASGVISKCERAKERALFFQAKVNGSQKIPVVPITKGCSTDKEYKLLSEWPVFNLIKAPNSQVPLLNDVDIANGNVNKLSHGWFGACVPNHKLVWKSRWMCGEAVKGEECVSTLGDVLEGLYKNKSIKNIQIGRDFSSIKKIDNQNSGWDDLVNKVLKLCKDSNAPFVLSSYNNTRFASSSMQCFIKSEDNNGANSRIRYLAHCLSNIFQLSNDIQPFPFFYNEWLFSLCDTYENIESFRECLQFQKELLDLITWTYDEIKIRNKSFDLLEIELLIKEYLSNSTSADPLQSTSADPLCSGLIGDNRITNLDEPSGKGMFILIVTVLRFEVTFPPNLRP